MARNYNNRVLRWVKVSAQTPTLKYGFQSGLDESRRALFGQTNVAVTDIQGLVIGANNPKPAKAKRKFATGWIMSFCSFDQIQALETAGYEVSAPASRVRLARTTNLSTTMYVTINGIKYAWQMPNTVGTSANPTVVGARSAAAGDQDLVFGAAFPKPPRYKFVNETTGDAFNIFGDPSTSEATIASAGFVQVHSGRYTQADLALMLG